RTRRTARAGCGAAGSKSGWRAKCTTARFVIESVRVCGAPAERLNVAGAVWSTPTSGPAGRPRLGAAAPPVTRDTEPPPPRSWPRRPRPALTATGAPAATRARVITFITSNCVAAPRFAIPAAPLNVIVTTCGGVENVSARTLPATSGRLYTGCDAPTTDE